MKSTFDSDMPKRSNLFQDVVAIIHEHMARGATVEESALLRDKVTGLEREVDVVIRSAVVGQELVVSVEATATARPADAPWVEKMLGKHRDLPTNKLVLVSENGFTKAARQKAESAEAAALAPMDLSEGDPVFVVVNKLTSIWPKLVALTPERATLTALRPDGRRVRCDATPDLQVFRDDGEPVGGLAACLGALIEHNLEKVMDDINLANIAEDRDQHFSLIVGEPWTIQADDHTHVLALKHGSTDELHAIQRVEVMGRAVIEVGKIDLTHQRLGEVTYAYGESDIGAKHARLVLSETEEGGQATLQLRDKSASKSVRRTRLTPPSS